MAMGRDAILKIIARLFREKGYFNTSISDISEAVGMRGGSLYYHIKSKEDALFSICDPALDGSLAMIGEVAAADYEPEEKLRRMIEKQIEYFIEHFDETAVFLIEVKSLGKKKYKQRFMSKRKKFESYLVGVIEEGMKKNIFRKGNSKLIALGIMGMINWMVIWYDPKGEWGAKEIKKYFSRMIMDGLLI